MRKKKLAQLKKKLEALKKKKAVAQAKTQEIAKKVRHDNTILTEATQEQTQFTQKLLKAQCTKMF